MSSDTEVLLRRGDHSEYVQQVQQQLETLGFSSHGTDGRFGRQTEEALQAFQSAYHLPPTGTVDGATWNMLFTGYAQVPAASTTGTTCEALVSVALHQVNDRYVFGADADENDPNEDEFDCAELISWSCAQLGVHFPDYSVSQIEAVAKAGMEISVDAAAGIRGALLFRGAGHNGSKYNHVALSLGTGQDTIEAMDSKHGVCVGNVGHRFTRGGYIPGITYQ
jgi:cell wall-associated NlpC family hydrolase